jgi:hypothetical protein
MLPNQVPHASRCRKEIACHSRWAMHRSNAGVSAPLPPYAAHMARAYGASERVAGGRSGSGRVRTQQCARGASSATRIAAAARLQRHELVALAGGGDGDGHGGQAHERAVGRGAGDPSGRIRRGKPTVASGAGARGDGAAGGGAARRCGQRGQRLQAAHAQRRGQACGAARGRGARACGAAARGAAARAQRQARGGRGGQAGHGCVCSLCWRGEGRAIRVVGSRPTIDVLTCRRDDRLSCAPSPRRPLL